SLTSTHDFTLRAETGNQLTLYETGTSNSEASVTLAAAGDVDVTIERGLSLGFLNNDTIRLDLDTFSLLNSCITGNGGTLTSTIDAEVDSVRGAEIAASSRALKVDAQVGGSLSASATANSIGLQIPALIGKAGPHLSVQRASTQLSAGDERDIGATAGVTTS